MVQLAIMNQRLHTARLVLLAVQVQLRSLIKLLEVCLAQLSEQELREQEG